MSDPSPELRAGLLMLSHGGWTSGPTVINAMMAAVPPGEASRVAMRRLQGDKHPGMEALIERGRRQQARIRVASMIEQGRWESDPAKLTRDHWQRGAAWRLRDTLPGALGVAQAAQALGVPQTRLAEWIRRGALPAAHRFHPSGPYWVTPDMLIVYRETIAKARKSTRSWSVPKEALWQQAGGPQYHCPHCGEEIQLTVAVGRTPEAPGINAPANATKGPPP